MKVHEYQAKELVSQYGIPVPRGAVATTGEEAQKIANDLGGKVVVKAQIHAGGRGQAGGIKVVTSGDDAKEFASGILGRNLVTHQTGPEGVLVQQVLIEEPADIAKELYVGIVIDGGTRSAVLIASEAGGVEIEEVAATDPSKILREPIDPLLGLQPFQGRRLAYAMNLAPELIRPVSDLMVNLYRLFHDKDCTLAEINPLVITGDNKVIAVDAKLNFDDDAAFRQKQMQTLRDVSQEDPLEAEASDAGISYVRLDGDVGCLVNGAGLAMATMDIIQTVGASPANFLDVGGGADDDKVKLAFGIILSDPKVSRVLVNIFGGILRCDAVARGVVAACRERGVSPTIVSRMLGTNAEEGRAILKESGLPVYQVETLTEAANALKGEVAS
jgi:succinyl-CoA synthetase beta subunit